MAQAPPILLFSIISGGRGSARILSTTRPGLSQTVAGWFLRFNFVIVRQRIGTTSPAPNWRQDKKYGSQHGQPDHGKAPTPVNAPTNSPSPGPRTPQQRGASGASARRQLCSASLDPNCSQPALRPIDHLLLRSGFQ